MKCGVSPHISREVALMFFCTKKIKDDSWKGEDWYTQLDEDGKYVFELITKQHMYFSNKDRTYRWVVRCLKILLLTLAMASTIVLGLKNVIPIDVQVPTGLVISAMITFITGVSSYFNFEEYWMRNISIHIKLNIIKEGFMYDAKANSLDKQKISEYMKKIEVMQKENITYWEKAIKRI